MTRVKKKWMKIVGLMLIVIMLACFIAFGLFYWRVKSSILGEIGLKRVLKIERVALYDWDTTSGTLDEGDRRKLFMILSHARKYDQDKDKPYLLDGSFLNGPHISFINKPGQRGDLISWEYHEGIMEYIYPGKELKRSSKYYLDKKYAQDL